MYEVKGIEKEVKNLQKKVRELNKRKKNLLSKIIDQLQETGDETITYDGKTYTLTEQQRHTRKGDSKKREDAMGILQEQGLYGEEAEVVYSKLSGAMRGKEILTYKLA
jgi:hypothetical protein